jgi:hypothetical protein
MRLDANLP